MVASPSSAPAADKAPTVEEERDYFPLPPGRARPLARAFLLDEYVGPKC